MSSREVRSSSSDSPVPWTYSDTHATVRGASGLTLGRADTSRLLYLVIVSHDVRSDTCRISLRLTAFGVFGMTHCLPSSWVARRIGTW